MTARYAKPPTTPSTGVPDRPFKLDFGGTPEYERYVDPLLGARRRADEKLARLRDAGELTAGEFMELKQKLIAKAT